MIDFSPANVKLWSRLGPRAVYGAALLELAQADERVLALSADLVGSSGLDRLRRTLPERVVNLGIAEQNLIGAAAGLAREGFIPFASSFAPFISLRAGEQIRMNLGYMKANVKAVALGGGLGMAHLGNSHYGLEDMAVMRSIPNLTIISPADGAEIFKAVAAAAAHPGPVYLRLTGGLPLPVVHAGDYDFAPGRAETLRKGSDAALIACGSMVHPALKAAELLAAEGLEAAVVNMATIKPLDAAAVNLACRAKVLVTIEEHSRCGGLGGAVAEHLAPRSQRPPHLILGLPDAYGPSGSYDYLLDKYGLTGPGIAASVREFFKTI